MDLGKIIRRAVRNQKKKGIQIVDCDLGLEIRGGKYISRGFSCPIGAVILEYQPKPAGNSCATVEKFFAKLGRDRHWILSFIDGADGLEYTDQHKRAYKLGKSIRKEFQIWR